ncbi:hypothetical protein EVAR_103645_1 [Eumeta japonica]|uniref:Uncharacterized protein n=1 Tax=Eumeta variegata TaxID=151549 RepID=A0A4C2A1B6_EUMVA|nr:hypothetical protein EVAR_103645_1 [Eumeta japonica]
MLMRMEMDNVCKKYRAMISSPSSEITMRDVVMKVMMEEELTAIKMKYMGGLRKPDDGPSAPVNNGEEMPSTSGQGDSSDERSKCRKRLEF